MMGCPHAPAPRAVYVCEHCGDGIAEGEEYIETESGLQYHFACLAEMSRRELLKTLGVDIKTDAKGEEYIDAKGERHPVDDLWKMSTYSLLGLLDFEIKIAEEDICDD